MMHQDLTRLFPFDTVWGHVATPSIGRVLRTRLDQVATHGHTPEKDDETGAFALIGVARRKILHTLQHEFRSIETELQAAGDMAIGRIDVLTDAQLNLLDRRLATAAATSIATMELIDRERARRSTAARGEGA